jgi:hypothetical protein
MCSAERLLAKDDLIMLRKCLAQLQGAAVQLAYMVDSEQQQQQQLDWAPASMARFKRGMKVGDMSQYLGPSNLHIPHSTVKHTTV